MTGRAKAKPRAVPKLAARPEPEAPNPPEVQEDPAPAPPVQQPGAILRAPGALRHSYKYVRVEGHGDIVFSTLHRKINAHCLLPHIDMGAHAKCHMDRSVPVVGAIADAGDVGHRVKGRPIGFLAAWLLHECDSKLEHSLMKAQLWKPEHHETRRDARRVLWEMRHGSPDVLELFALELQEIVPADFADVLQLWEPESVF